MVGTANDQRKSQRASTIAALAIVVGLLLCWPAAAGFADWMNESNAPDVGETNARFVEADSWDTVSFNMDSTALKDTGSFDSQYVWENASGDTLYSNITHSAGVITTTAESTVGAVGIVGNISWTSAIPYYEIYFAYTAKQAYEDNVVQIWLQVDGISNTESKAKSVALTVGGVTLYSKSIAATDNDDDIDENITINANDLRRAIIDDDNGGNTAYFKLKVVGAKHTGLTFAGSAMYTYNAQSLMGRDEPLILMGALVCAITAIGIFVVQPKYSMPILRNNNPGKGGF